MKIQCVAYRVDFEGWAASAISYQCEVQVYGTFSMTSELDLASAGHSYQNYDVKYNL